MATVAGVGVVAGVAGVRVVAGVRIVAAGPAVTTVVGMTRVTRVTLTVGVTCVAALTKVVACFAHTLCIPLGGISVKTTWDHITAPSTLEEGFDDKTTAPGAGPHAETASPGPTPGPTPEPTPSTPWRLDGSGDLPYASLDLGMLLMIIAVTALLAADVLVTISWRPSPGVRRALTRGSRAMAERAPLPRDVMCQ